MDPITAAALINTGGQLLGGIGSYLGGKGDLERLKKNYNRSRSMLLGDIGQDLFDPEYALALQDAASIPQLRTAGGQIARASGNISAADAQGALWEKLMGTRMDNYSDLWMSNELGKKRRDQDYKLALFGSDAAALAGY
ncbi:MAG: hypothetical protein AB1664_00740 [Thermodesulfobacteriota bacterium]